MKKLGFKRIIAIIGIIVLAGMYVALLIEAILGAPGTGDLFMGCVAATIAVPIIVYLMIWVYGAYTGRHTMASLDAMSSNRSHDQYGNVITDNAINTVIFDIGDVLTDFAWKDYIEAKGYSEDINDRLIKAVIKNPVWNEYDRGTWTNEEILQGFIKADPELESYIRDTFTTLDGIIRKRDRAIPWIKSLQAAGYKVLVLSNFSKQALDGNPEAMAFLDEVDGGILSYTVNQIKPDAEIYQTLIAKYNLTPEKCVFIDDRQENIDAAIAQGIHGIVYKTYEQVREDLAKLNILY